MSELKSLTIEIILTYFHSNRTRDSISLSVQIILFTTISNGIFSHFAIYTSRPNLELI